MSLFEQELNTIRRLRLRSCFSRMDCGMLVGMDDQFAHVDRVLHLWAIND